MYNLFIYLNFEKTRNETVEYLTKSVFFLHGNDIDADVVSAKIKQYDLKFNFLNDTPDFPIYDVLLNNNAYKISRENFNVIIRNANGINANESIVNFYTQIFKLPNKHVKEYVQQNIEDFVQRIILFPEAAVVESEESFIELLNTDVLLTETKVELVQRNECIVSDITKIKSAEVIPADTKNESIDLRNVLFKCKKVKPLWKNVLESFKYNGDKLDQCLAIYLNDEKIIDKLIEEKLLSDEEIANKEGVCNIASAFYSSVLKKGDISLSSFSALMKVSPWQYNKLEKYSISSEKMKALIDLKNLSLTPQNYAGVKECHPELLSKYIISQFEDFISKWKELNIYVEANDIRSFFDGNDFDNKQKKELLSTDFNIWHNIRNEETFVWAGKKVIELEFSGQLFASASLILKSLNEESDVLMFVNLQGIYLSEDEILNAINEKTGEEYKNCCKCDGKHRRLANTPENMNFCKVLQEKGLISSYKPEGKEIKVVQKRLQQ